MGSVLAALEAERCRRVVLWVLADNARARRFYDRAGFAPDGGTNILTGLGGVLEVRYSRDFLCHTDRVHVFPFQCRMIAT